LLPFYETIRKSADAEARHVRRTGPASEHQYAHVKIRVEPLARGTGIQIEPIKTEGFPEKFFPGAEQGILSVIATGVLARFEMTDLKVTVTGGSYHDQNSSLSAFEKAAEAATRNALQAGEPYLLEAICTIDIEAPEEFLGSIMGLLNKKRGRIEKLEVSKSASTSQVITACVPQMELAALTDEIASLTQRRATYTSAFIYYDHLPRTVADAMLRRCPQCGQRFIATGSRSSCPKCDSRRDSEDGPMVNT